MLIPSGIKTSPFSNASANRLSFNAVLYECALIVLIKSFLLGSEDKSFFLSKILIFFSLSIIFLTYIFMKKSMQINVVWCEYILSADFN